MKSKACLILLLLASALLLSACGKGVGARVTSFCDRGTRSVQNFENAQLITAAEADGLRARIRDVCALGEESVKVENIVAVTKEERASKRERLRLISLQIVASVHRLESDGTLHVKNEAVRRQLEQWFALSETLLDFTQ